MSRKFKMIPVLILLFMVAAFLFAQCAPADYTSEQRREQYADRVEWVEDRVIEREFSDATCFVYVGYNMVCFEND
jgi:hypothetical protein